MEKSFDKMDFSIIFASMKNGFTGERSIVLPQMIVEREQQDPLVSSLYITDIGYYPHAEDHFRERKTPIPQHVLIYCVEGAGWFRMADREYRVEANQYFILPPDRPHSYGADKQQPWTIYWIHFMGEHAAVYAEGAETPQLINPAVNSRIHQRNTVFEEIFSTLEQGYDGESLRYASSLLHYYLASMRYLRLYRQSVGPAQNVTDAIIHYLEENIEKRITLNDVARYMGYSQSHLSMLFRKETGDSPLNYLNRLRIETACHWLSHTNLKVNQICHKVGIDDPYYFSRIFHKFTGMSPVAYRKSAATTS